MACGTLRGALAGSPCRSSRCRNGAGRREKAPDACPRSRIATKDRGRTVLTRAAVGDARDRARNSRKIAVSGGNCSRNDCSRNAAHAPSFFARKRGFCDRGNALSSRWFFPHVVRSGVPLHRGKLQLKLSLIVHYPKEKKKRKNKVSSIARFARTFILHVFRMTH